MPIHHPSGDSSSLLLANMNDTSCSNKIPTAEMNVSMEYETPPADSLPMDDDEEEDDYEEYDSDGEEQEIAFNPACRICGLSSYTYQCQGKCRSYFHRECIGIFDEQQPALCLDCSANRLLCTLCQETIVDNELQCGFNQCQRTYHSACLISSNLTTTPSPNVHFCPFHICATCHLHKRSHADTGHLFTCLYCPTAYHGHERCLPAGCLSIPFSSSLCCPVHIPIERKAVRPVTAPYCHICELTTRSTECTICVECPTTIHLSCVPSLNEEKSKSWKCDACIRGVKPLYGDIGWIKMGRFRSWPSRILHERHAPDNLLAQERTVGEFLIQFFGSKEFFWANLHHYLPLENRCIKLNESRDFSSAEPAFKDGLRQAKRLYQRLRQFYASNIVDNYGEANKLEEMTLDDAYDEFEDDDEDDTDDESMDMNSDESMTNENEKTSTSNGRSKLIDRTTHKHAPTPVYRHIKTLRPVGDAQILRLPLAELSRCDCEPNKADPCSSDEHCLNRMLKYECHPHVCAAGDKCKNQRFQKRNYPGQQAFWTAGRGWGLKALVPIKEGDFVNEYVGELITYEETERRVKLARKNNVKDFYFLVLDKDRVIDAGPSGNLSRFANHSCDPNLRTEKWNISGDLRVGLFATRAIEAGEELTFEYGVESEFRGDTIFHCLCGADTCTGFMGRSRKPGGVSSLSDSGLSLASGSNGGVSNGRHSNKHRIRSSNLTGEQDADICFGCGLTGQLLVCQMSKCSRKFHPKCIKVKGQSFRHRSPTQRWICPSHRCDICGIDASIACADCLNSYCAEHQIENMRGIYCLLHGQD